MSRVSTNAGKNPFSRSDKPELFLHMENKKNTGGIKIDLSIKPKFKTKVSTEYFDLNHHELFFNDVVFYKKNKYTIKYDSINFYWIIKNIKNQHRLSDVVMNLFKK